MTADRLVASLEECIADIELWMGSYQRQADSVKTVARAREALADFRSQAPAEAHGDERAAYEAWWARQYGTEPMLIGWKVWQARAAITAPNVQPKHTAPLPDELGQWLTAIGELYIAMGRPPFEATEPTLGVVETLREAAKRLAAPAPAPVARKLLEAFPGCGDMRGMESWCAQVRAFLRTESVSSPAVAQRVPAGWKIESQDDGGFVVRAPDGSAAYAHANDDKLSIAANVLAMLAAELVSRVSVQGTGGGDV